jgi:hypothetical protein
LAYAWRPSAAFEAKLGVPASVEWRPDDTWTISAAYFPLVNVNVEARRRLGADWSFVAFYRTDTQIYFLADRLIDAERFFVFDQRAAVGFERSLGGGFTIEVLVSWLFDRELFQGTNFISGRTDVVEFQPGRERRSSSSGGGDRDPAHRAGGDANTRTAQTMTRPRVSMPAWRP